uniref:Uncharacterized protein n=1 Tax=Arundo donax TaxID=35708 RepID=A0A0A9FJA0_ARUDO
MHISYLYVISPNSNQMDLLQVQYESLDTRTQLFCVIMFIYAFFLPLRC